MFKNLTESENFLGIPEKYSSFANSEFVIIQAPLERTVSYGSGTSLGPNSLLGASHFVEFFDEEVKNEVCFKAGICTLESLKLNDENKTIEEDFELIEKAVDFLILNNKIPVVIGGEHSISFYPVKSFLKKMDNFSVLQIDAHSDLRYSYQGTKHSHASVMRRIYEINNKIVQVGIRAISNEEYEFIEEKKIDTFFSYELQNDINKIDEILNKLGENVYLTLDVDGLDPSIISETGTPEPGGLNWYFTLALLKRVSEEKNIIGFDLVELSANSINSISAFNSAKLLYKIISYIYSGRL